ncbi:MAG: hypothetical protein HYW07_05330 [Candidatus Latescibacteria bacterium]|nr:hypothetical protein [Candidatus Latescibacterota bacterium]
MEVVNGRPRLAIQDGENIDEKRVGQNLVGVTEARSVAGCNGDSDGHGEEDCYKAGGIHANGKYWQAEKIYFGQNPGPRYQGDWHHVRARFKLNLDERRVVFRTGQHPNMKIDQLLVGPYFGPGVPHEQWIWIDELRIYTDAQ